MTNLAQALDTTFMKRAITLAARGRGKVEPNPMVGAVLVAKGKIIGEGWHQHHGGPHAEVQAIRSCKVNPKNATCYVTLEPCCHHGKTPPCTEALLHAGISRVIVAMKDPFHAVSGQGIALLRRKGLQVEVGLCEAESRFLNEAYLKRIQTGLPWVTAKWAQTLDGYIATATGHSQWISGPKSRRVVHQWRGRVDGILGGIGTVLADDPLFTAREVPKRRTATRIIIDKQLQIPLTSKLVQSLDQAPLLLVTDKQQLDSPTAKRLTQRGVELLGLPLNKANHLSLRTLLKQLAKHHQMTHLFVEGGQGIYSGLLKQKLVDQVLAFVCPRLLSDETAMSVAQGKSCKRMDQGLPLQLVRTQRLDDDLLLDYRLSSTP